MTSPDNICQVNLSLKSNDWKIFEGELFIITLSTTPLQIVCKLLLHSKVIFKSMTSPDDICQVDLLSVCHLYAKALISCLVKRRGLGGGMTTMLIDDAMPNLHLALQETPSNHSFNSFMPVARVLARTCSVQQNH